ncbi:MAG: TCR/Tet family MFS transporter [Pseudomonadota bacterium]
MSEATEPAQSDVSAKSPSAISKKAGFFVLGTVFIDAMGIGIIIPVTPDLVSELGGIPLSEAALWAGYLSFSFATMQFLFAPIIGNLSDRFGRRPILISSLAMLAIDYMIMAAASALWVLFVGRLLAGVFSATHSTANAYMADIYPQGERAKAFGLIGAAFGLGFVVGPVIGGIAGEFGTRVPFIAAAILAGANAIYGYLVVPETLKPENRRSFSLARANPLGTIRQLGKFPSLTWIFLALLIFNIAHHVYPAIWSFYTKVAFGWSNIDIGVSLALVGIGFAIVQGALIRPMIDRFGEIKTVYIGLFLNIIAMTGLGVATESWMVYALMPFSALGMLAPPALHAILANRAGDDSQGEMQGAISAVQGITIIASPILMTQLFSHFTSDDAPIFMPGMPFLGAAALAAVAFIPLFIGIAASSKEMDANR